MAVTNRYTPTMGSVTISTAPQSIYTLLSAIFTNVHKHSCSVQIQLDTSASGVTCYVGNSNVTSSMCGANLSAGQATTLYGFDSNILNLDQIYLLGSGSGQVNIITNTR